MRRRFGPSTGGNEHDAQEANIEAFRREEDEAIVAALPAAIKANPQTPAVPSTTPSAPTPDRWHKWGALRVTVHNLHLPGQDTVLESDYASTIMAGIAKAKAIRADYASTDVDARVVVEVHGGIYRENVVIDDPYIDLRGIGRPQLYGQITVTSDCTKTTIEEFVIWNDDIPMTYTAGSINIGLSLAGIIVESGAESGVSQSDIQIMNCILIGPNVQMFANRWIYVEGCQFICTQNYVFGSVYVEFVATQTKWTKFSECRFHAAYTGSNYRQRGCAMDIAAVTFADGTDTWFPNLLTWGPNVYPLVPCLTGVLLDYCEIDGFSRNYGWNMQYLYSLGIEGSFINNASGSIHHLIFCDSDAGVNAFTWFDHSDVASRYLAEACESGTAVTIGFCYVWFRQSNHIAPDNVAVAPQSGSAIIQTQVAAVNTNASVFGKLSATHARFFYANSVPLPVHESATLINCSSNANATVMLQGYFNY